jgi:hypothetical protein
LRNVDIELISDNTRNGTDETGQNENVAIEEGVGANEENSWIYAVNICAKDA